MPLVPFRSVPLLSVLGLLLALAPSPARACRDSGVPVVGPREPWDAGPGCEVFRDSCGIYEARCVPDAGPDGGPPMCSPFVDAGEEGPPLRRSCTTDSDCPSSVPTGVCGSDGFCGCASEIATSAGCSIAAPGARPTPWFLGLLGALLLDRRRSRRLR
jgi:hypothetical protein